VVDVEELNAWWGGAHMARIPRETAHNCAHTAHNCAHTAHTGFLTPGEAAMPLLPDRPAWREFHEERAAIREFDGGQPRHIAEYWAWLETWWRF